MYLKKIIFFLEKGYNVAYIKQKKELKLMPTSMVL